MFDIDRILSFYCSVECGTNWGIIGQAYVQKKDFVACRTFPKAMEIRVHLKVLECGSWLHGFDQRRRNTAKEMAPRLSS